MTSRIRKVLGETSKTVAFDVSDLKERLRVLEVAVAELQNVHKLEAKSPRLLVDHGNIHALSLTHEDIAFAQRVAEEAAELKKEKGEDQCAHNIGNGGFSVNEVFDLLTTEEVDDDNPYEGPIYTPDSCYGVVTPPHIAVHELQPSLVYKVITSPERYEPMLHEDVIPPLPPPLPRNELGNVVGTRNIDDAPSTAHVPPHIARELQQSSLILNDLVPVGARHIDFAPSAFARRPPAQHRPPDAESEMATFTDEAKPLPHTEIDDEEYESPHTVHYVDSIVVEHIDPAEHIKDTIAHMERDDRTDLLSSMTLKELQEVARSIHLPLPRPKKKKEFIAAIELYMQTDGNLRV